MLGGVSVLIGGAVGVAVVGAAGWLAPGEGAAAWLPAMTIAAGFGLLGLADDLARLSPVMRLTTEVVLATAAAWLALGGHGDVSGLPPWGAGILAAGLIVAAANAYNLIDNSDGLAAGVGLITLLGLAASNPAAGWDTGMLALAGALAAFIPWSWPAARIYLGDAGTLAIGGLIGLAIWHRMIIPGSASVTAAHTALGCGLIAGYVLFDPIYVVMRRLLGRRPVWIGGVDHPSHDLRPLLRSWSAGLLFLLAVHLLSVAIGLGLLRAWLPVGTAGVALVAWLVVLAAARRGAAARVASASRQDPAGRVDGSRTVC